MTHQQALDKMTKAKTRLIDKHPFYAHIAFSTPMVETNDPSIRMATDMLNIYYNPEWVMEQSINEISGVICHEVLHIAFLHGLRKGERDHHIWNMACDFAINHIALDGGLSLPKDALFDDKYKDWTANQIYNDLMKDAIKIELPGWGHVMAMPAGGKPLTDAEKSELEQEIKIKVTEAAEAAKARGKLPGQLQGLIEAVGAPKINWHDYIQSWVSGTNPDDYTLRKPQRTYMAVHDVYMPSVQHRGAGRGLLSLDTSGSVSDAELVAQVTEMTGVIEMCNPERLTIIQHDAKLHSETEWEPGDELRSLKITGRGGTCIMPSFQYLEEHADEYDWMIIMSDMEIGDWPASQNWPSIPVLLASTGARDTSPANVNATYIQIVAAMEQV